MSIDFSDYDYGEEDPFAPGPHLQPVNADEGQLYTLDAITAADVTAKRVRYLWDQRIPLSSCTLMPGEEGIGKSTVGVRILADITRGTLPGEFHGTPRNVIVMASEDDVEEVVRPRLEQAGADLTRVLIIRARVDPSDNKSGLIIPRDLGLIEGKVKEFNAVAVWVDSLVTVLPEDMKSISYKDTAKVLGTIRDWAAKTKVALVAPWHLNKAAGSDTAVRIMDSRAFRTSVRSMLLVVPDPDAPEGVTRGIVALDKANAGRMDVPALRYELRSAPYWVDELDEETGETRRARASCGVADWIGEVDGDGRQIARDALIPAVEKKGTAQQWLREYLEGEGEALRSKIVKDADADGFTESAIKRASRKIPVVSREETGQENGVPYRHAYWSLPSRVTQSDHTYLTDRTDPTGEGSSDPTTTTEAIFRQSGQSGQSDQSHEGDPTGDVGDPTGCDTCGRRLTSIDHGHATCIQCRRIADHTIEGS